MKKPESKLLSDTLETAFSESERERLLANTLRAARGRKRRQRSVRVGIIATIALLLLAPWREERGGGSPPTSPLLSGDTNAERNTEGSERYLAGTGIRLVSDQELLAAIGSRPAIILGDLNEGTVIFLDAR